MQSGNSIPRSITPMILVLLDCLICTCCSKPPRDDTHLKDLNINKHVFVWCFLRLHILMSHVLFSLNEGHRHGPWIEPPTPWPIGPPTLRVHRSVGSHIMFLQWSTLKKHKMIWSFTINISTVQEQVDHNIMFSNLVSSSPQHVSPFFVEGNHLISTLYSPPKPSLIHPRVLPKTSVPRCVIPIHR